LLAFLAQLDRATVFVRFITIFEVDFGFFKTKEENMWINLFSKKDYYSSVKKCW